MTWWMMISSGLLNSSGFSGRGSFGSSGYRDSSDESTNNRGMVDDVVGGVGGGVLLDSDLGDMVDLVVDLVTNVVDNRSCGNVDSWGGNMVGSRGNSNCGSRGNTCVIHTT